MKNKRFILILVIVDVLLALAVLFAAFVLPSIKKKSNVTTGPLSESASDAITTAVPGTGTAAGTTIASTDKPPVPSTATPPVTSEPGTTDPSPGTITTSAEESKTTVTTADPEKDTEPPTVTGSNFTILLGDTVSYKKMIKVSDNEDPEPTIKIDSSEVDLDTPGKYKIVYTVTDRSGNTTVLELTVTVKEKKTSDVDSYNNEQAAAVIKQIVTDDMNDLQKAYAVYYWTKHNIKYSGDSDKSDYRIAARDGFKTKKGDCFTFFAVSKLLLEKLEIKNYDMKKLRTNDTQSNHYWSLVNVGDGWYHFDCTPFKANNDNFFMVTDKELSDWDAKYYAGEHNYDHTIAGLPKIETKSIQDLINYNSSKLKLN